MGLLVDSGVFILCERRTQPLDLALWREYQPFRISAVTVSELLLGVHRADTPERREKRSRTVEKIIATIPAKPFDVRAARIHSELRADLFRRGTPIGAHDLLIAATALAHGDAVLTTNVSDFERIPKLRVLLFEIT